jgi:hypothetical protein
MRAEPFVVACVAFGATNSHPPLNQATARHQTFQNP